MPLAGSSHRLARRKTSFPNSPSGRRSPRPSPSGIIVTTLDFTTNYIVIGEFATAAGLSTYNLIAGPLFYLAHGLELFGS